MNFGSTFASANFPSFRWALPNLEENILQCIKISRMYES